MTLSTGFIFLLRDIENDPLRDKITSDNNFIKCLSFYNIVD